jgi:hypothetical protein
MEHAALPDVLAQVEEGFVDFEFALVQSKRRLLGQRYVEARGLHHGKPVGFAVELGRKWAPQEVGADQPFYWGTGVMRSLGDVSDALLRLLDGEYGTNLGLGTMQKQISVGVVALAGDPRRGEAEPLHLKLFFNHDVEDEHYDDLYAEVFLNILPSEKRIQLHEKDPDYRFGLVRSLAGIAG